MLNKERVSETFSLFTKILNIEDARPIDFGLGPLPVNSLVPLVMKMLAEEAKAHPDKAEGILNWMTDGILYMKGDLDVLPTIDFGFNIAFDTEVAEEQRRKALLSKNK